MFKKRMSAAVIGAAVLAMATPAHAATKTKLSANFAGNGIVTLTQTKSGWSLNAQVTVPAGKGYVLSFTSEETAANGGVNGLAETDVCHFAMAPKAQVGGCNAHGKGLAPNWRTKTERPDTFVAEIDQIAPDGTRTTVLAPVMLSE